MLWYDSRVAMISYASSHGLINPQGWRGWIWRHRIAACLTLSLASGPCCVNWMLHASPLVASVVSSGTVLTISLAAQALAFVLWMATAIGLLYEERELTEAEEAMMPLTLIVLSSWAIIDLLAGAVVLAARLTGR